MLAVYLAFLGLCAGSFVNALFWRIYQQSKPKNVQKSKNLSVINGRSMCPNCEHELIVKDLIPVFSWLFLHGKCRYCKKPISVQYPVIEAATAAIFVLSYLFWPVSFSHGQWLVLATWLVASVGLMALLIYDARWMLLPNRILYPTLFVALVGRLGYMLFFSDSLLHATSYLLLSVAVSSGIFWLIFIYSKGKWIGYGDVRLGWVTGVLLAKPQLALLMIFLAAVLGSVFAAPALLSGKKSLISRLPFGPFLIFATFICVLWGQQIINWYTGLLA